MVRVQVQLEPVQHRRLKQRAKRLGVSVAEVVRRCIDGEFRSQEPDARDDRVRRALAVCGKYTDRQGATDFGRDHDVALADAYRR